MFVDCVLHAPRQPRHPSLLHIPSREIERRVGVVVIVKIKVFHSHHKVVFDPLDKVRCKIGQGATT